MHWKFIPPTPHNNRQLVLLQSLLDPVHAELFFKNAVISDTTLEQLTFKGVKEVRQAPGNMMASHGYHCGVGWEKIAEAHGWFSGAWYQLHAATSTDLVVSGPTEMDTAADQPVGASVHGMERGMVRAGSGSDKRQAEGESTPAKRMKQQP